MCSHCNTQYNALLSKYRTRIRILEDELDRKFKSSLDSSEISERDFYILHQAIYLHSQKYFGAQNEYRINIELKHARYLASKSK